MSKALRLKLFCLGILESKNSLIKSRHGNAAIFASGVFEAPGSSLVFHGQKNPIALCLCRSAELERRFFRSLRVGSSSSVAPRDTLLSSRLPPVGRTCGQVFRRHFYYRMFLPLLPCASGALGNACRYRDNRHHSKTAPATINHTRFVRFRNSANSTIVPAAPVWLVSGAATFCAGLPFASRRSFPSPKAP